MADYNIQMSYFNGTSYDNLYPKVSLDNVDGNLSISKIAGILPVANGGTGESNESDALGNLINNSSMAGTLSNSDYLGVFNSSTGRKLSLLSLKNFTLAKMRIIWQKVCTRQMLFITKIDYHFALSKFGESESRDTRL